MACDRLIRFAMNVLWKGVEWFALQGFYQALRISVDTSGTVR